MDKISLAYNLLESKGAFNFSLFSNQASKPCLLASFMISELNSVRFSMIDRVLWTPSASSLTDSSKRSKFCTNKAITWCSSSDSIRASVPSSDSFSMSTSESSCNNSTVPTYKYLPYLRLGQNDKF